MPRQGLSESTLILAAKLTRLVGASTSTRLLDQPVPLDIITLGFPALHIEPLTIAMFHSKP